MSLLDALKLTSAIVGVLAALLRLSVGAIRLVQTIRESSKFEIRAFGDALGTIQVQIDNKSDTALNVVVLQLVRDLSRSRRLLRLVVGLAVLKKFNALHMSVDFNLPASISAKGTERLYASVDPKKYPLPTTNSFLSLLPVMAQVEISGYVLLRRLEVTQGRIPPPSSTLIVSALPAPQAGNVASPAPQVATVRNQVPPNSAGKTSPGPSTNSP
jgi:hypothetical protein